MKRKMKTMIQKMLCATLAVGLLLGGVDVLSMDVYAAEISETKNVDVIEVEVMDLSDFKPSINNTRTALNDCTILFTKSSAGLHVEITTGCANGTASYLGVKDIKIEQKVWYGWKTVATSSGAQQSNCSITGLQFNYANVTVGETYRISCVHYGDYDGYHELSNQTSGFVFSY